MQLLLSSSLITLTFQLVIQKNTHILQASQAHKNKFAIPENYSYISLFVNYKMTADSRQQTASLNIAVW